MKIAQLISAVSEAGARSAAQQASMQAAATGQPSNTIPFPRTQSSGSSTTATTSQQPQTQQQTQTTSQSAPGPTGDPTLNQPLPARDPNRPGLGTRIGQGIGKVAKGIGAVAGVPAGIGRAIKKGYQAGANTVGGPGAAPAGAAASTTSGGGGAELDQLKATLQAMDQRMRRAGFESKKG